MRNGLRKKKAMLQIHEIICVPQSFDRLYEKEERHIIWEFIPRKSLEELKEILKKSVWVASLNTNECADLPWLRAMNLKYPWAFYGLECHWDALAHWYTQSEHFAETMLSHRHIKNIHHIEIMKQTLRNHVLHNKKSKEKFTAALEIGMIKAGCCERMKKEPLEWPQEQPSDIQEISLYD